MDWAGTQYIWTLSFTGVLNFKHENGFLLLLKLSLDNEYD